MKDELSGVGKCSTTVAAMPPGRRHRQSAHLRASHAGRHVRAAAVLLASSHGYALPSPPRASATATDDHNVVPAAGDSTRPGDVVEGKACDGDARCGSATVQISAVIVLLDQDTVSEGRKNVC